MWTEGRKSNMHYNETSVMISTLGLVSPASYMYFYLRDISNANTTGSSTNRNYLGDFSYDRPVVS